MMRKRILCTALCLCLCFMPLLAAQTEAAITIREIPQYGNLVLSISGSDFLAMGYDYGDVVTVRIGANAYDMPVGSSYSDVDNGCMICRVNIDAETGEDTVTLAICMGDLATAAGVAVKTAIDTEPGYRWDYVSGAPVITFSMKEEGGYAAEYELRQLERTNARADYAQLTDAQFANFRAIDTAGMGEGVLYRSSSPVNPELGRNAYADAAVAAAGIRTIVNLADSHAEMEGYPGYDDTAYAGCSRIALNLSVDVLAEDFQVGLGEGLRFIIANEGPYLIHCTEGKDRAGFVSALLECLMGADADAVTADYMLTYVNYYGVEPGSAQYDRIAQSSIRSILADAFGIADIGDPAVSLADEAEAYLMEQVGLSESEVAALRARLGKQ